MKSTNFLTMLCIIYLWPDVDIHCWNVTACELPPTPPPPPCETGLVSRWVMVCPLWATVQHIPLSLNNKQTVCLASIVVSLSWMLNCMMNSKWPYLRKFIRMHSVHFSPLYCALSDGLKLWVPEENAFCYGSYVLLKIQWAYRGKSQWEKGQNSLSVVSQRLVCTILPSQWSIFWTLGYFC